MVVEQGPSPPEWEVSLFYRKKIRITLRFSLHTFLFTEMLFGHVQVILSLSPSFPH